MATTEETQARLERLAKAITRVTGIEFTIGYIGNCESGPRGYDRRSWYAFAAHSGRVGTDADRIGGFSTENLDQLVEVLHGAYRMAVLLANR
jgi:hypothetical protein